MVSLLQLRRSGQAEAVSADLILFGNSLESASGQSNCFTH